MTDGHPGEFAESMLNKWLKVEITDGRTLIGRLQCTDNAPNLVLGSVTEYWLSSPSATSCAAVDRREIGSAVIPSKHVKKVYMLEMKE